MGPSKESVLGDFEGAIRRNAPFAPSGGAPRIDP